MYTRYTYSWYCKYLPILYEISKSVSGMIFAAYIAKILLDFSMFTQEVEIQNGGQILCAHKASFLMLGHNFVKAEHMTSLMLFHGGKCCVLLIIIVVK